MICLQENVCFLHDIQLQGLCVSPPVNTSQRKTECVHASSSVNYRLCVTGSQAFINHTEFASFLTVCLPRLYLTLSLLHLLFFPGKPSNPNLNWCCHCLLELRHSTNKYLNVIYKRKTNSYAAPKPRPQYKPGLGGGVVLQYQYSW